MEQSIILSDGYSVPTKSEVQEQTKKIVAQVEDGTIDPLRAYGLLTALEKTVSEARKAIANTALAEADKYGTRDINVFGANFTIKETGVRYDYSQDGEWQSYQDQLDEIRARQKGRETTLQQLKQCAKSSTTILQVTLTK